MSNYTVLFNGRLVDGTMNQRGTIVLCDDKIFDVIPSESHSLAEMMVSISDVPLENAELLDLQGMTVMPAFVDMHVHFRYPGQSDKEDLETGSKAAAAGGVGTVVLMPNTNPVVSSVNDAIAINNKVEEIGLVRSFQTVSLTKDFDGKNINHLCEVENYKDAKTGNLLVPVVTEDGKDVLEDDVMKKAMQECAKVGAIVSCHCEDPLLVDAAKKCRVSKQFLAAEKILAEAEDSYTDRNIKLGLETGCRVHIAHCSTEKSLEYVRNAKKTESGKKLITCEVTPHHFGLSYEMSDCNEELVNPPLRSEKDRKAVIAAIKDGTVDVISTDHAPHTLKDKEMGACGFTGIELLFPVTNTILVKEEGLSLSVISKLMAQKPAEILKIKEGKLQKGYTANIIIVNDSVAWTVDSKKFLSKGKYTPFDCKQLFGKILRTYHKGILVYDNIAE